MQWPHTQVAWVCKAIVCIQLNVGPCTGIALGSDRWQAVIRGINVGITVLVSWVCEAIAMYACN